MFIPLRDDNPTSRFPFVTVLIIAVNVVVFAAQALKPHGLEMAALRFGAVPYQIVHFHSPEAAGGFPPLLTLFTSLFLHGSFLHIAGNMLYLWIFGNNIEDVLGSFRFALFYLTAGLFAALAQVVAMPSSRVPMIGASGAIAGVLGAYMILFPRARVKTLVFLFIYITVIPLPAGLFLGLWFVMQLLSVGLGGGVAWFAHVGGFLAGIAMIILAGRRRQTGAARPA
jgi:membrane associated rhomboid family serine protease